MKVFDQLGSLSSIDIRGWTPRGAVTERSLNAVRGVEVEGNWFGGLLGEVFESVGEAGWSHLAWFILAP